MMLIDQAITPSMPQISILDVLTDTEQWLNLHKLFGPLSGFDAKLDDPRKRVSARCSATVATWDRARRPSPSRG